MPLPSAVTRTEVSTPRLASSLPAATQAGTLVLDTNTVLDWLVFGDGAGLAVGEAIASGELRWLATPRMLAELHAVLARPLARRWESARELALTIDVERLVTSCAEPRVGHRLVCRDPADQGFIDLAFAYRPAVLLTRDRALLALQRLARNEGVRIQTATAWLAERTGISEVPASE